MRPSSPARSIEHAHFKSFHRAAEQRFTTAEFLLDWDFALDALYLAGYSVECILKALILHLTPETDREQAFQRLKSGAKTHYPEYLKGRIEKSGASDPAWTRQTPAAL